MAEPRKATPEEIEAGLALLAKKREHEDKVKKGLIKGPKSYKDLSPDAKKKLREGELRRRTRNKLLEKAAAKAGIVITTAMIDAELKKGA